MATQTIVTFVDDIDGSTEGVEHYTFNWLGSDYEIDLAPKSAKKLVDVMNLYVDKATRMTTSRASGSARSGGSATPRPSQTEAQTIRAWARDQGFQVSDRGRVSQGIKEAYDAAH